MLMTLDVEFADLRKYQPGSHPASPLHPLVEPLPSMPITDFVRRTDLDKLAACVAVVDPVHVRVRYPLKAAE
jgi:hypothetical protein